MKKALGERRANGTWRNKVGTEEENGDGMAMGKGREGGPSLGTWTGHRQHGVRIGSAVQEEVRALGWISWFLNQSIALAGISDTHCCGIIRF